MEFMLRNQAVELTKTGDEVAICAPAKTDFFIDICTELKKADAPFYYADVDGDFIIRSKVRPQFVSTYDAGCILIHESDEKWIKLAFENTDLGYPSIVSVVTNGISDDCNGERIGEEAVWLQAMRKGDNWALHYSADAVTWKMVRYFRLPMGRRVQAGISAQAPTGDSCRVTFQMPQISANNYSDIRRMTK